MKMFGARLGIVDIERERGGVWVEGTRMIMDIEYCVFGLIQFWLSRVFGYIKHNILQNAMKLINSSCNRPSLSLFINSS